jgi:hypothetical protein
LNQIGLEPRVDLEPEVVARTGMGQLFPQALSPQWRTFQSRRSIARARGAGANRYEQPVEFGISCPFASVPDARRPVPKRPSASQSDG